MTVHVKMLDKDGIGFRHITVEDPVCIQLVATDPDIGHYPVLRVGRIPAIVNYPLTNDAYLMNEAGETISKISFKDCLREVGKDQVEGLRPDRKGLIDLLPFDESNRTYAVRAFASVSKEGSITVTLGGCATDAPALVESLRKAFNEDLHAPACFDLDGLFIYAEPHAEDKWSINVYGRRLDVSSCNSHDLAKFRVIYHDDHREEFTKWYRENFRGSSDECEAGIKAMARTTMLASYYEDVCGSVYHRSDVTFTPITLDPEVMGLYARIDGQMIHVNDLTRVEIVLHNLFFRNPLSINPEKLALSDDLVDMIQKASTVFYHARPDQRIDDAGKEGWTDYRFSDGVTSYPAQSTEKSREPDSLEKLVFTPTDTFHKMGRTEHGSYMVGIDGKAVHLAAISVGDIVKHRVALSAVDCFEFDRWNTANSQINGMDSLFETKVELIKTIGVIRTKIKTALGGTLEKEVAFTPVILSEGNLLIKYPHIRPIYELTPQEMYECKAYLPNELSEPGSLHKILDKTQIDVLTANTVMLRVINPAFDNEASPMAPSTMLAYLSTAELFNNAVGRKVNSN